MVRGEDQKAEIRRFESCPDTDDCPFSTKMLTSQNSFQTVSVLD